jgi:hypothetical protein
MDSSLRPRNHFFVLSPDPSFGSFWGGSCDYVAPGTTAHCGWPREVHKKRELIDARRVVQGDLVCLPNCFDLSYLPSNRSLTEILRDVAGHNPKHGYNCVCMDELIREVRVHAMSVIPDKSAGREAQYDVSARVRYVVMTAVKYL